MTTTADIYDDLTDHLAGPEPDYTTDPGDHLAADDEEANRLLRHLARARRQADSINLVYDAEITRLEERRRSRLDKIERKADWLQQRLALWHQARLGADPAAKTIELPAGTLRSRAQQPEWRIDDERFLAWAAEHRPDLVSVPEPRPRPDRTAVKQALKLPDGHPGDTVAPVDPATGEVVPGVDVVIRDRKYDQEVNV